MTIAQLILKLAKKCVANIKGVESKDSKDIIKILLDTEKKLYVGVEMILHAITVSCVRISVESFLEFLVSIYEDQFAKARNVNEDTSEEEMNIRVNGPLLANCNPVVKDAMTKYWGGGKVKICTF